MEDTPKNEATPPQDIPGPVKDTYGDGEFQFTDVTTEARGIVRVLLSDAYRVVPLIAFGVLLIKLGPWAAIKFNESAFSPWGLFGGAAFITAAMSHGLRRAIFPKLDLHALMVKSAEEPVGAGLSVIGVCIVLAAIFSMVGAFLRT